MKLLELKVCPKCGYIRKEEERAPAYECPRCGIIYGKYRPPAPPPAAAEQVTTPHARPAGKPSKAAGPAPVSTTRPGTEATTLDALLLSVALGVVLEPVFSLTRLLKHLGFRGQSVLSDVYGGGLGARFFSVEVSLAGTLLSIALAALILFALGAQRSVSLPKGRRAVIVLLALVYIGVMQAPGLSMMSGSFDKFGSDVWPVVENATITLTMVVLGAIFTMHLVEWSRWLKTPDEQEAAE